MRCPSCNHDNPADASFCEECGTKLESICPACKASVSPGARFCKKCGTAIGRTKAAASTTVSSPKSQIIVAADGAASEALEGERKTVTALFADIKGSTALMEELDPEEAHAIVEPALRIMVEAVHRYGGYVARTTGDGIFALFGAPTACEDHPQRALYAALRLQEELKRYSAGLREAGNLPVEARVGVNSGEVVAYSVETDGKVEYRLVGHTANLASRMEMVAPTGSIAASEYTRKLCEGYFSFKPLGPMTVKGVSEPVAVYEVTGFGPLRTRLQRATARGLTKFVGREREMDALRHVAELARSGHGQVAAAIGEPGAGKSRLFHEFKLISQSEWMTLEAFSVSHGKATAYLPVVDLLHEYFSLELGDTTRRRREKVGGKVLMLDRSLEDTLPFLFTLLGLREGDDQLAQMDAQVRRRRTHEAIKRILLRESLNQPLMVTVEDLHWIDGETQALLNLLVEAVGNARLLLLVNYRPEYRHEWGNRTYYTQLRLDPLGRESAGQMLEYLLGAEQALAALKQFIIARTEGNPFFMEEIVQALLDDGALVRNGQVKLTKPLGDLRIPLTVQAMLAARIDRLPATEKELLQTLSVIGKEPALELIRRVTDKDVEQLEPLLTNLQLGEFIYEQPSFAGAEYTFKHALTQEVAYNSLLANRRITIHEQTGCAIEKLFEGQLEDHYSELAHHYLCSSNAAKAVHYTLLAAEQAFSRAAYTEATSMIWGALPLLDQLPSETERLSAEFVLRSIENRIAFVSYGGASRQREHVIQRMCEVAKKIGGQKQAESLMTLANLYFQRGEVSQGIELANRCLSLTDATSDPSLLADIHMSSVLLAYMAGKLRESLAHDEDSLRNYKIAQVSPSSRIFLNRIAGLPYELWRGIVLCSLLQLLGRVGEATNLIGETLRAARESKHVHGLAFVLTVTADPIRCFRREPELGLVEADEAIAISEENGFSYWLHRGRFARGWARVELGQPEQGIAEMEAALTASREIGGVPFWPFVMARLGYAYAKTGQTQKSLATLNTALEESERTGARMAQAEMLRLRGEALLMQEGTATAEAERSFRTAIEVARAQEAKWWELRTTTSLARLLRDTGRHEEARTILAGIYSWFTEGFDTADLKDAKELLDELSNSP